MTTNLQALRISKGWTQEELAKHIGVHRTFLSRLERGWIARIPPELENRLKAVLGQEWSWEVLMRQPAEPRPDAK